MNLVTYKTAFREALNLPSEVVDRLFNLFFTSIQIELNHLKNAIELADMQQIYVISHKISGSASNLRLEEIKALSYEIEIAAKEQLDENYSHLYERLLDQFNQIKLAVEKEDNSPA